MFSKVGERTGTPVRTTITTGVVVALLGGLVPLDALAELVDIGTLFAFIVVAIGVLVLRRTRPDLTRAFRCPGVPVVSVLAALASPHLMLNLPAATWLRFVVWMARVRRVLPLQREAQPPPHRPELRQRGRPSRPREAVAPVRHVIGSSSPSAVGDPAIPVRNNRPVTAHPEPATAPIDTVVMRAAGGRPTARQSAPPPLGRGPGVEQSVRAPGPAR